MNQSCVSIGPAIANQLQCPRNNQNEECSGNGVCTIVLFDIKTNNVSKVKMIV